MGEVRCMFECSCRKLLYVITSQVQLNCDLGSAQIDIVQFTLYSGDMLGFRRLGSSLFHCANNMEIAPYITRNLQKNFLLFKKKSFFNLIKNFLFLFNF